MATSTGVEHRREPWRYVLRAGISVAVVCAVLYWLLVAGWLWAFRCDESCGAGDYDRWQYTGQAVLAVSGAVLAVIALVFGFTPFRRAYRTLLAISVGCALTWTLWVLSGTF